MKLSVIIVNYNVRAYLEQCLRTTLRALEGIDGDVFVVDNLSTDGSVEMVRGKFPQVKLIANTENVGFSRANNQAIKESTAEYVVLLNPDTVVGEDVFHKVLAFMDANPKAGGLGVKMIDGTGAFLPESKRGLPTPAVAFYKIIGLTRLFPRSKVFGRYHLGHLPENQAARIEILSGACMFLRKETLDKVGLLDESFFMYGEDIDLSYRITLGGYENWYFPDARIIHYKGESTKKSSVNYVFVFYNAMAIFAQKHFTRRRTDFFSLLINGSIYLSAAGAIVVRFLRRMLLPMLDFALTLTLSYWAFLTLVDDDIGRSRLLIDMALGTAVVQGVLALFGAYDRPVRLSNVAKGIGVVMVLMAALLLPYIIDPWWQLPIACAWLTMCFCSVRLALHLLGLRGYSLRDRERQRILAIGSPGETKHALALLWQTHFGLGRQEQVEASMADLPEADKELRRRIRKNGIDEVVFCAKDLKWGRIIELMEQLRRTGAMFKIAQPAREFIIGPSSIESLQDLNILEAHAISSSAARRRKRTVDVIIALLLLVTLPVAIWFVDAKGNFIPNIIQVIRGKRSWVGYHPQGAISKLPKLVNGIIDPVMIHHLIPDPLVVQRINITYAKDYHPWQDVKLVWKGFGMLGG
ncbi:MAG: glycosyltransferase [Flavobacteriales bacterium]|nr:glycosyltransferase [Flavobacteriales bacterium]